MDTFKNRNKVFFSTFASNISYDISKMRLLLLYLTSFSCSVSSTPLSGNVGSCFFYFFAYFDDIYHSCVLIGHIHFIFAPRKDIREAF